jgi:hypothetical protein
MISSYLHNKLHDVTSQKIVILMSTAVKASNSTHETYFPNIFLNFLISLDLTVL